MESQNYTQFTVAELVASQPARSIVFERRGIDYCCGGKTPLVQACRDKGLDVATVISELEICDKTAPEPGVDWNKATLSELCDHIESVHHGYLKEAMPRLSVLTEKVSDRHGEKDPRLAEVANVFAILRSDMESHTQKEERILFPLIRGLESGVKPRGQHCGGIVGPISVMMAEHDDAGHALARMRELTDDYQPSDGACNTHRAMLHALREFELDMHMHVHKENAILFPRAINSEQSKVVL